MPIRTKDFMLFLFLAIIFLLVGGVSWSQSGKGLDAQEANLIYGLQATSDEGVIYQATLPEAKPDERASRLQMRQGEIAQLFASDELSDAVVEEEKSQQQRWSFLVMIMRLFFALTFHVQILNGTLPNLSL